ncbi:unnamed protein product, partial [Tilletia caries]
QPEEGEEAILIQFRLPGGRSLARSFRLEDELEGVFAYIETASLDADASAGPLSEAPPTPPANYEHLYGFELVLGGYPRRKVTPTEIVSTGGNGSGKTRLRDVAGLNDARRANVIVEGTVAGMSPSGSVASAARGDDDSSGEDSD